MSTKKSPKKPSRFQIRFQNPAQRKAYIKMMQGVNRVSNDGTLIGGNQLFEKK